MDRGGASAVFGSLLGALLGAFLRARGELKADLAGVEVEGEVGGEGPLGTLRDEAVQEGGLAFGEELGDLLGGELLLEDGFAEPEAVGRILGLEVRKVIGLSVW